MPLEKAMISDDSGSGYVADEEKASFKSRPLLHRLNRLGQYKRKFAISHALQYVIAQFVG